VGAAACAGGRPGRCRWRSLLRQVCRESPLPDSRRRTLERCPPEPKNIGLAIQTALRQLEAANPDLLAGIFGDSPWTNRERLPDETLKNLIEHFSTQILSVANVPEDELGNAYEFLIKKFADDSGHTAAELYTNRTVVHLMTQLLAPQAGESIYDPTCGTGGMLISALVEVQRSGGEYRTLKLYGQERNLITSGIARMNLFLHGVEDFQIIRGDTLADPRHIAGNGLRQFDVVLANPPYSIKQWDRTAWENGQVGPQLPRHATARPGRLCLPAAHPGQPERQGSLRRSLAAWRAVPQRRTRDAHQDGRAGLGRSRDRSWPEPLLQLADGSLRRRLQPPQTCGAQGQGAVHRRLAFGDAGTGAELPETPSISNASCRRTKPLPMWRALPG
jgi:hypothetical protein